MQFIRKLLALAFICNVAICTNAYTEENESQASNASSNQTARKEYDELAQLISCRLSMSSGNSNRLESHYLKTLNELKSFELKYRGTPAGLTSLFHLCAIFPGNTKVSLPWSRVPSEIRSILLEHYIYDKNLDIFLGSGYSGLGSEQARLNFYSKIAEHSSLPHVCGAAILREAETLKIALQDRVYYKHRKWTFPLDRNLKDRVDWLRSLDAAMAKKRCRLLCETLQKNYKDVYRVHRNFDSSSRGLRLVREDIKNTGSSRRKDLAMEGSSLLNRLQNVCVGAKAPGLAGKSADGVNFRLSDFQGKIVVLMFDTVWCTGETQIYEKMREIIRLHPHDVEIVGILVDCGLSTPMAEQLINLRLQEKEITWPVTYDCRHVTADKWTEINSTIPQFFIIDRKGFIREQVQVEFDSISDYALAEELENSNEPGLNKR